MGGYFILDGREVVPADLLTWALWFQEHSSDRIVAKTRIGELEVSTVFLGLGHRFGSQGPPLLFETMVFGLPDDQEICERCSTYDQAEVQHAQACLEMLVNYGAEAG